MKSKLSEILFDMVNNAEEKNVYVQYHLFGIVYAEEIKSSGIKITKIVEDAGIKKSIATEVRKGMKLSKFVELKR